MLCRSCMASFPPARAPCPSQGRSSSAGTLPSRSSRSGPRALPAAAANTCASSPHPPTADHHPRSPGGSGLIRRPLLCPPVRLGPPAPLFPSRWRPHLAPQPFHQVASIPSRRRPRPLLAPGASTDRWSTVRPGHPLHAPLYNIPVVFFPLPDTSAPPSNLNLRFPSSPVPFGSETRRSDEILAAVGAHSAAQCVVLSDFPILTTAP